MAVALEDGNNTTRQSSHEDLCIRTSWVDAATALSHINKGRASGSRCSLWVRKRLQRSLGQMGDFSDRHAGKVLFVAFLVFATFCVGLKSAKMVTDIHKLWVQEGGRLERELNYVDQVLGKGYGNLQQLLISTAKDEGVNILNPSALLTHMKVLKKATEVTVDMFDITWTLKDLCYAPSFPSFDSFNIEQTFDKITPCMIITPLDCFWEGSKLLGPEYPVHIPGLGHAIKWHNLNPQKLLDKIQSQEYGQNYFPFTTFQNFMKKAGITTGYMEKPCLNPMDPDCPVTAPNYQSKKLPEVGAELTGGCYSYASNYMHWPQDLIVGGTVHNQTGHISKGHAIQSIVQLMGSQDMYEFWKKTYRVHNLDWTQDKAREVLEAWMDNFSKEVTAETIRRENETKFLNIHSFTSSTLDTFLKGFSEFSIPRVSLGYGIVVIYACISLSSLFEPSKSLAGLGIAGVILVAASIAAGLGLCALLGLPFNAATTQILPFFMLGLGVDDMFLLVNTVLEVTASNVKSNYTQVGEILKRSGVSVVITSICNASALCAGALVPVPALRIFCIQAALLVMVILSCMVLVFPAVISLDLKRRKAARTDILCCFPQYEETNLRPKVVPHQEDRRRKNGFPSKIDVPCGELPKCTTVTRALPPPGGGTVTRVIQPITTPASESWRLDDTQDTPQTPSLESLGSSSTKELVDDHADNENTRPWWYCFSIEKWTLQHWVTDTYGPFITREGVKTLAIILFIVTLGAGILGVTQLKDGLDLTDVVPRDTPEFEFLSAQQKYFGFYNMHAVTQGNFEYPTNQQLIHDYHAAFTRVKYIIKNDDGGLPESWLSLFREWLLGLQNAFDNDWESGCITQDKWFQNASDDGVLAYKLLIQTGRVDNPIDRSLVTQVRLVDSKGIINPKAFYNYLTAWVSIDSLAYSASQADLRPVPRTWFRDRHDSEFDLKIPKSPALAYAALPFYLHNLGDTSAITEMIEEVRAICIKFEEKGLPNFPTGVPFTFWEQYIKLRFYLLLALVAVLIAVFLILSIVLMNIWAAALIVLVLAALVLQLAGVLGTIGVKLSAAPAVLLVVAVGVGVEFTVHITLSFLTSVGDRNRRVKLALSHMATPVLHGAVSTMLTSVMLLFSEFDFIRRYFFYVLCALVLLGILDGLVFLPVLLSIVGPPPDITSRTNPDRLPTPSPPASPPHNHHNSRKSHQHQNHPQRGPSRGRRSSSGNSSGMYPRLHQHNGGSNLSLTTITEEPGSVHSSQSLHSSHEIVVEPQVVVETTSCPSSCSSSSNTGANGDNSHHRHHHDGAHVTTKVTATAKVKVEVHTPMNSSQWGGNDSNCRSSSSCSGSSNSSKRSSRRSSPHSSTNSSCSSSCSRNDLELNDSTNAP